MSIASLDEYRASLKSVGLHPRRDSILDALINQIKKVYGSIVDVGDCWIVLDDGSNPYRLTISETGPSNYDFEKMAGTSI